MAKQKKGKKSGRFALGMLLYAMIFAVLVIAGLRVFWNYIDEYEQSRPNVAMDKYMQSFDEAHLKAIAADFIETLDQSVQNPDEAERVVADVMSGELRYAKKSGESSENKTVYVISSPERDLGRVVLTKQDNPRFGFSPWSVAEESYDFSWLLGADELTVPNRWTVSVGSTVLGEDYIVEDRIPFALLEDFYGNDKYDLPYMRTYRIDNYVGSAPFEITNAAGESVARADSWDEELLLDTCTQEQKDAMSTFVEEFLPYYIRCLSNSNRAERANYENVKRYLVSGSDLDKRLYEAIEGQYWAHSQGDTIQSINFNRYLDLGNGYYAVDITYELETIGNQGSVLSTNNAKIILTETAYGLKATGIISY